MALAWKAGWVHALTSSNLVSSATSRVLRLRRWRWRPQPSSTSGRSQSAVVVEVRVRSGLAAYSGDHGEQAAGDGAEHADYAEDRRRGRDCGRLGLSGAGDDEAYERYQH